MRGYHGNHRRLGRRCVHTASGRWSCCGLGLWRHWHYPYFQVLAINLPRHGLIDSRATVAYWSAPQGAFFLGDSVVLFHVMSSFFFITSWLVPNHYPPWVNFHSESLAFLGLAFLVLAWLRQTKRMLAATPMVIAVLLLAAVPWAQYFAGLGFFAGDAFISSFFSVALALAIALGHAHANPRSTAPAAVWLLPSQVLLTAALASGLLAIFQWLSLTDSFITFMTPTDVGDRAMANLGQPNQLGTLLLMGLVALVLLFELLKISQLLLISGAGYQERLF